jgi:hypothetical protein
MAHQLVSVENYVGVIVDSHEVEPGVKAGRGTKWRHPTRDQRQAIKAELDPGGAPRLDQLFAFGLRGWNQSSLRNDEADLLSRLPNARHSVLGVIKHRPGDDVTILLSTTRKDHQAPEESL